MADPFELLREPVVPADPDPDFAASLRARLERACPAPRSRRDQHDVNATHAAQGAAIPYLAVPVARRRAMDWYADVFGARLAADPIMMPDGRVGHAELEAGRREALPVRGVPGDRGRRAAAGRHPVSLSLRVPDVAETLRRAIDGGDTMPRAMYDDYGSRNATVLDPFGHRWLLHTALAELPETDRQGDVGYAWLTVPDPDRAAEFYAAVLGWEYSPGYAPGGRNVVGQSLPMGLGRGEPGWHLSYAVDDVAAAVARVRSAGGTASDPDDRPYGTRRLRGRPGHGLRPAPGRLRAAGAGERGAAG